MFFSSPTLAAMAKSIAAAGGALADTAARG
jgi:hypothetical protein